MIRKIYTMEELIMKSRKRRLFLIVLSMMLLLGAQSVLAETVWTYPVNILR